MANSSGDERAAKGQYLKYRVQSLRDEIELTGGLLDQAAVLKYLQDIEEEPIEILDIEPDEEPDEISAHQEFLRIAMILGPLLVAIVIFMAIGFVSGLFTG